MIYFRKITLYLFILMFLASAFIFYSPAKAQQPPKPPSSSALCQNAQSGDYLSSLYFQNTKANISRKTTTNQEYQTWTLNISYVYSDNTSYDTLQKAIQNGTVYAGSIDLTEKNSVTGITKLIKSYPANTKNFDFTTYKTENKQTTYTYYIKQKICWNYGGKNYTRQIIPKGNVEFALDPKNPDNTPINQPQDPNVSNNPNEPARTRGDFLGYQECLRKDKQTCDTCCNKNPSTAQRDLGIARVPTIGFIECWMTCSIDNFLTNMFDWLFSGLENLFQASLGLH